MPKLAKAELLKKRTSVLNTTVNHYNSTNRSATHSGACKYTAPTAKSKGCAVGRLIRSKKLCKELDEQSDSTASGIFEMLPLYVKVLGSDFLVALQSLHDNREYWNKKGLTENGVVKANNIAKRFKLTLKIK